jgi:hypothetical protein
VRTLDEVQGAWLRLFHEVPAKDLRIDANELAGPFVSVRPLNYDPLVPLVMYVGQATYGEWYRSHFLAGGNLEERRKCTEGFLKEEAGRGHTEFWRFGNKLSELIAEKCARQVQTLQNLVWTNLSKIGALEGNPKHPLRKAQRDLAIETLCLELDFYRPALVVFVTGDYEGDVIDALVDRWTCPRWHKERANDGIWWCEAGDSTPAILWTYHPGRKRDALREGWLQQALELFSAPFMTAKKVQAGTGAG